MQRSNATIQVLIVTLLSLGVSVVLCPPLRAQGTSKAATDRPGDATYTPTKLEWAALELQADYGNNWTKESPVAVAFGPLNDGKTVLCLLQYTPDVAAETVKTERDTKRILFEKYVHNRGWSWLRLQFQEKVLPRPTY